MDRELLEALERRDIDGVVERLADAFAMPEDVNDDPPSAGGSGVSRTALREAS